MFPEAQQYDATAEFYRQLSDPTKWVVKPGVPLFKPHVRNDPASGQTIQVDLPKLYRIAANMQRMERAGGVPVRMTLGHTEPGKPETEQPPVGGYYRNPRVQQFGPNGEPAIVADEWLDPQYATVRKNFPYRSAEYYDDTEQITGVALLTRDPYLDLGVVAYSRSAPGPVRYSAAGTPRVAYEFLTAGEPEMWPNGTPPNPHGAYNGGFLPPPAPGTYPTQTSGYVAPPQPPVYPTPYSAGGAFPVQYGPNPPAAPAPVPYGWQGGIGSGGNDHSRANIGHSHPSGGAVYGGYSPHGYGPGRYATEPPPPGPGGPHGAPPPGGPMGGMGPPPGAPPGPGGPGMGGLDALHHHLGQAVEHLSRYLSGRRGTQYSPDGQPPAPMPGPFPPGGPMGGMPKPPPGQGTADSPYARNPRGYADPHAPTQYTISGRPVGHQLEVEQLRYQLSEANRAIGLIMYERDQADTEWCVAEMRRLAAAGFPVGEFELAELKNRPREQRPAYLEHIATKYSRVPTDVLPPLLGDPTPGPADNPNRPATREEMEAALKISNQNPGMEFTTALQYARGGANPTQYGAFGPPAAQPLPPGAGAWNPGAAAPGLNTDPYPEPSANGAY